MVICRPLPPQPIEEYNVLGFDIETYSDKNTFNQGVFTSEDLTINTYSPIEVQEFLNSPKARDYIIVTTNLGFDFLGTFKALPNQKIHVNERNGILYSASFYQHNNKHRKIPFYDTVRYFPKSVEGLGKIVKLPKIKHPSFFPKLPINEDQDKELLVYCENDARISYLFMRDFVLKFIQENKLKLKLTIASISMLDFKTNYLNDTFEIEPLEILDICFKGFYGGRTECFKRGVYTDVTCVDYNSLYPSQMLKPFPDPTSSYHVKKCSMFAITSREGICYCEGVQNDTYIPLLPVRTADKLLFPTGVIKGYYTFIELRLALKNGFKITHIGEGVIYTRMKKYFNKFVTDKFAIRSKQKENGDPLEVMTKLSLNSIFGKWAYNFKHKSTVIHQDDLSDKILATATNITKLSNGYMGIESDNGLPTSYSVPIWSAYTTAYARILMYNTLTKYKDSVAYCDTDSLFLINGVTAPHSKLLGELDQEYQTKTAIFVRPKFYFTNKLVIKGVHSVRDKNGKQKELNINTFKEILDGLKIYEERFTKFRSAIRSKEHHKNGKLEVNQIIQTHKILDNEDGKRLWSKPFSYNEAQDSKPLNLTDIDYAR